MFYIKATLIHDYAVFRDKLKRAIGRKAVWSPNDDVQHREEVEDEIFQL